MTAMADYIERKAVMDELAERLVAKMPSTFANGIWAAHNTVRDFPAADVAPVVRCKDCQFVKFNSSNGTFRCMSHNGMNRIVGEHEFCSYGERGDN